MRDSRAGGDVGMLTLLEEIKKLRSHLVGGDIRVHSRWWWGVKSKRSEFGGVLHENGSKPTMQIGEVGFNAILGILS